MPTEGPEDHFEVRRDSQGLVLRGKTWEGRDFIRLHESWGHDVQDIDDDPSIQMDDYVFPIAMAQFAKHYLFPNQPQTQRNYT